MYLELIDALGCPQPHEPAPLVAAVDQMSGRDVVAGTLGCPVCDARIPIIGGAVVCDEGARVGARPLSAPGMSAGASEGSHTGVGDLTDESVELARWMGALLDLTAPGGVVLLHGRWASAAAELRHLTGTAVITLNPPGEPALQEGVMPIFAAIPPLKAESLRGAAIDAPADHRLVATILTALASRARLVGWPALPVPVRVRELARNTRGWVGELIAPASADGASAPVPLRRAVARQPSE